MKLKIKPHRPKVDPCYHFVYFKWRSLFSLFDSVCGLLLSLSCSQKEFFFFKRRLFLTCLLFSFCGNTLLPAVEHSSAIFKLVYLFVCYGAGDTKSKVWQVLGKFYTTSSMLGCLFPDTGVL